MWLTFFARRSRRRRRRSCARRAGGEQGRRMQFDRQTLGLRGLRPMHRSSRTRRRTSSRIGISPSEPICAPRLPRRRRAARRPGRRAPAQHLDLDVRPRDGAPAQQRRPGGAGGPARGRGDDLDGPAGNVRFEHVAAPRSLAEAAEDSTTGSAAVANVAERAGIEGDRVEAPSAPGARRGLADEADAWRRARRSEDPDELPAPAAVGCVKGDRLADTRQSQPGAACASTVELQSSEKVSVTTETIVGPAAVTSTASLAQWSSSS